MIRLLVFLALFRALPGFADPVLIGSYHWQNNDPRFGGFSGIAVFDAGRSFVALSDRGAILRGTFTRQGDRITGVTSQPLMQLRGAFGEPLIRAKGDSEGLARAPDGTLYVAFEWMHGLRRFGGVGQRGGDLLTTAAFAKLQDNASLEALAIGPDGALYTMPERSGLPQRPFPVYRLKDGVWDQPFDIPRRGPYLIVGADIGPDARLYILERDFAGIGFRTRVRRFGMDGTGETVIIETRLRKHDNLEGISIWRDQTGLRMTLISDNNFNAFQRTEIVEYRLTDT